MNLSQELVRHQVESLNAETERWCWKAIAKGVGHRVWRSDGRTEGDSVAGYKLVHDFAILEPGQHAPGTGVVFGPFSKP